MENSIKSIRSFIGAKNYLESRNFYRDLGFQEIITSSQMSYFSKGDFGFYLQDYYVKDWVDNSMIFLEVKDIDTTHQEIINLNLQKNYPSIKISDIQTLDWGKEFFLHDPSGVLWHIGIFY